MSTNQQDIKQQNFSELQNQYYDRLKNSMAASVRNPMVAEDVTSAAFAKAFEKFDTFRGESSFYTWVYAIARNEARARWRKTNSIAHTKIESSLRQEAIEPDTSFQALERSECLLRLKKILKRLPAVSRQVLVNHFVHGHSVRKIARAQRIPQGTVLSRIFTAKQLLRSEWEA